MCGWSPWWSSGLSLHTAWCRCPEGREAHLQQCGGQFARPFAELCSFQRCCFQTRRWCSWSGCSPQCRCRMTPCEILSGVNAEELKAVYPLHRCLVDGDGCVFSALSPVIHHQLLGLVDVEWEVVLLTPFSQGTQFDSIRSSVFPDLKADVRADKADRTSLLIHGFGVDADWICRYYVLYTLPDETRHSIWILLYVVIRRCPEHVPVHVIKTVL